MAFPSNAYVYEFLYRGQPAGSPDAPAWHVIVGLPGTDAFGAATLARSPAMTPEQAAAGGLPLPAIIATIDRAALAQVAALTAEIADLKARLAGAPAAPA